MGQERIGAGMTLTVKTLQLIPRDIQAIQITEENLREVVVYVQGRMPFHKVKSNSHQIWVPSADGAMDILEPGDWLFDDGDAFRGATDEAVQAYYVEVPGGSGDRS